MYWTISNAILVLLYSESLSLLRMWKPTHNSQGSVLSTLDSKIWRCWSWIHLPCYHKIFQSYTMLVLESKILRVKSLHILRNLLLPFFLVECVRFLPKFSGLYDWFYRKIISYLSLQKYTKSTTPFRTRQGFWKWVLLL